MSETGPTYQRRDNGSGRCRRDVGEGRQLCGDHGGELRRATGAQIDGNHVARQAGQLRVIQAGRQHVLASVGDRPGERGPAREPSPVPGGVLGEMNTTAATDSCPCMTGGSWARYLPYYSTCSSGRPRRPTHALLTSISGHSQGIEMRRCSLHSVS
jgi:hypothetical protein